MTLSDQQSLENFIAQALQEDVGQGDHTSLSTIPAAQQGKAQLIIKEDGVLAGLEVGRAVFQAVDASLNVELLSEDGDLVKDQDVVLRVSGRIHSILKAERLVLNIMQRMSGIATVTHQVVQALNGTDCQVLDTRKTTPGLRFLEKAAVKIGGGVNHRFGLYDMILIKDNHVDYAGGIAAALEAAYTYRAGLSQPIPIEIEVRNMEELEAVLAFGKVDRILLDNFNPESLKLAVDRVDGRFITEASGGITLENAGAFARSGVDFISMGALTHSVKSLDMSLKAEKIAL